MGKCYNCNQVLLVLNIYNVINGNASTFAYIVTFNDSYDIWHSRLGHVNASLDKIYAKP